MKKLETDSLIKINIMNAPITLVDVGARGGVDTKWARIKNMMKILAFEPDEIECARLQKANEDPSITYAPYALGAEKCEAKTIHMCKQLGCSSFLEPHVEYINQYYYGPAMEVVGTTTVKVSCLDDLYCNEGFQVDCMKIDVQGWELHVLHGSCNLLPWVKLIELEVGFNPQYIEQPLFSDVDKYLRQKGFSLLGLKRACWRRRVHEKDRLTPYGGTLMHADALYYNEGLLRGNATERDVIALCVLLSAYKQDDFVTHLLIKPHKALNSISEESRRNLLPLLLTDRPMGSRILSRVFSKVHHRTLRRLAIHLRQSFAEDWHDAEFF